MISSSPQSNRSSKEALQGAPLAPHNIVRSCVGPKKVPTQCYSKNMENMGQEHPILQGAHRAGLLLQGCAGVVVGDGAGVEGGAGS